MSPSISRCLRATDIASASPQSMEAPSTVPDPELALAIERAWPASSARWPVLALRSCTSTMDVARDLLERGDESGRAVVAREQREGRGRRGRTFVSPPGGIYMTAIMDPPDEISSAWRLCFAAALAAREALEACGATPPTFEWPNDLMLSDRKVGGVLADLVPARANARALVLVGVGLNIGPDPRVIDRERAGPAGSIPLGPDSTVGELVVRFLLGLARISSACTGHHAWLGVLQSVRAVSNLGQGEGIVVRRHDGTIVRGLPVGIRDDGALELVDESGFPITVRYGEVVRGDSPAG